MQRSYISAAWYALAGIMFVLFLDFRSVRHTILAMLPLLMGILFLFGIMGFLQIPLNSANMIILPLILGIGIDDGVHIVHDYRRRDKTKPFRISSSTAGALTMTSMTSILGFCSLMTAEHRGLQSLGLVLTMGVACCMFTSLSILPALLTRMSKWILYREARRAAKRAKRSGEKSEPVTIEPNDPQNGENILPISEDKPIPLWKLEAFLKSG
jgi:predicted RND superfamily exporter protein